MIHAFAVAAALAAVSPQWQERLYQPCEYTSASGVFVLRVQPSDPHGQGGMHCRLLENKTEVWSKEVPWTFDEAGVSDHGEVVGYRNSDRLRIRILAPDGSVRRDHEFEYTGGIIDGPSLPNACGGVLVHAGADLAFIRVLESSDQRPPPWWSFRISTGERTNTIVPSEPIRVSESQRLFAGAALAVGDTGLTLCQWLYSDYEPPDLDWFKKGVVFSLVDLEGKTVWSDASPDEFTDRSSKEASERLGQTAWSSMLLAAGPDARFALRHFRKNERVEYSVAKDASSSTGWRVTELSRSAFEENAKKPSQAEPLELALKKTVSLRPDRAGETGPIHHLLAFGFTDANEIELFRRERPGELTYVRLDSSESVLFESDLSSLVPEGQLPSQLFDLGGDRWLIALVGDDAPCIEVDVRTRANHIAPLPGGRLDCSVAPMPSGGYLALLSRVESFVASTSLVSVDADGSVAWQEDCAGVGDDEPPFRRALCFGKDVVRVGEDEFAILAMDDITIIDAAREARETIELEPLLGHSPVYPNTLRHDGHGGLYLEEGDRIWQIDRHAGHARSFQPKRADGSTDDTFRYQYQVAPDGRVWVTDRTRLYRLDDSGVADLVLGSQPRADELTQPEQPVIDALGRVLVSDRITCAVHVFAPEGARLFVCQVEPSERGSGSFCVARGGNIWLSTKDDFAVFDLHGERIKTPPRPSASEPPIEHFSRHPTWDAVDALDPATRALAAIRTRPDGKWLAGAPARALLPDGSAVLFEQPQPATTPPMLHFYAKNGEPTGSVELPPDIQTGRFSASQRWIIAGGYCPPWALVRVEDRKVFRFERPSSQSATDAIGQTPDGRGLLVLDLERMQLTRYDLP